MKFFAIVSIGRTGSTMLQNLLDSHPEIECKHELFHPDPAMRDVTFYQYSGQLSRQEYLRKQAYTTEKPVKGFKMPVSWLPMQPGAFEDIAKLGYGVIRLKRRDVLAHFVSLKLAILNSEWTSRVEYVRQSCRVEPWEFVRTIATWQYQEVLMDALCKGLQLHEVFYEDVQRTETIDKLLRFLGATPGCTLNTPTIKARTVPLQDSIENYSELTRFFEDSPFSDLFAKQGPDASGG